MGNQHPFPCCTACYDGYDGFCLPIPSPRQAEGGGRLPTVLEDDDSYFENYRFNMDGDKDKPSTTSPDPVSCRHSSRHPLDISTTSISSSQVSDPEGANSITGRGKECRSDPSIIRRTTTSCEREDIDDEITFSRSEIDDEIALSRSDSNLGGA